MRTNMIGNKKEKLKEYFEVKVSISEKKKLKKLASEQGKTLGAFVRNKLIEIGTIKGNKK